MGAWSCPNTASVTTAAISEAMLQLRRALVDHDRSARCVRPTMARVSTSRGDSVRRSMTSADTFYARCASVFGRLEGPWATR